MSRLPVEHAPGSSTQRTAKDQLVRRLALLKLCELRRSGMSRSEIRLRLGMEGGMGQMANPASSGLSLPSEPLPGVALSSGGPPTGDQRAFLSALDALDQGIAFFSVQGTLLHANRTLTCLLASPPEGKRLRAEVQHFAASLCGLVHLRELTKESHVEELATREVPTEQAHYRFTGSYIGMGLFGEEPSLLIALEKPTPNPLSNEALRERFGLSKKECGVLRLLIEGKTNEEIAGALFISPYTARHHTQHLLRKLGVSSRTEAAGRVLRA